MLGIKTFLKSKYLKYTWMKKHPGTIPMNYFEQKLVDVGKNTYGELNVISFNGNTRLIIGNFVSIAQNVTFLLDVEHNTDTISTFPFVTKIMHMGNEAKSKGDIIIDDDVWIGYGATIMSGVHIGQGAVVASGAVVCKDVAPYAIVGGTPAKLIRYRFSEDKIKYLLTLDYSKLEKPMIKAHLNELYESVEKMELRDITNLFEWLPKK